MPITHDTFSIRKHDAKGAFNMVQVMSLSRKCMGTTSWCLGKQNDCNF